LVRVNNQTPITIIQHHKERRHAMGTAKFVEQGLARTSLSIAWGEGGAVHCAPQDVQGLALLYPAPHALLLTSFTRAEHPAHLLVLDGTWSQAHCLYRDNPWLHALPHVALAPAQPSRYLVRKEPRADYLSTLESIIEALRVLEPHTTGLDNLLQNFVTMVERQAAYARLSVGPPRIRHQRNRVSRAVAQPLLSDLSKLWVIYAESCRDAQDVRKPLYWVAQRGDGVRRLECFIKPSDGDMPTALRLAHMGLDAQFIEQHGMSASDAYAKIYNELDADSILVAWNQATFRMLPQPLTKYPCLSLKTAYCNVRRGQSGSLDESLARENIKAQVTPFSGRAAQRLGAILGLLFFLRQQNMHALCSWEERSR